MFIKINNNGCEIEDFVEIRLCKLKPAVTYTDVPARVSTFYWHLVRNLYPPFEEGMDEVYSPTQQTCGDNDE